MSNLRARFAVSFGAGVRPAVFKMWGVQKPPTGRRRNKLNAFFRTHLDGITIDWARY